MESDLNKLLALQRMHTSLKNIGVERFATSIAKIAVAKAYEEGYLTPSRVNLGKTRMLFTLLHPLTEKTELMAQIINYYLEKDSYLKGLREELQRVSHDCEEIIHKATQLMEQIQVLHLRDNKNWKGLLNNDYNKLEDFLQNTHKTLHEVSNVALSRNRNIDSFFDMKKVKELNVSGLTSNGISSFTVLDKSEATRIFKFLIRDEFEANQEYMDRIKSTVERLGWFRIGKMKIEKEKYDINSQIIKLDAFTREPIYEEWVISGVLREIDLFPRGYDILFGVPEYLKIIDVDRDTAKALYENQSEDGYPLVMKIDIDKISQTPVVKKIQLITRLKIFDVKVTNILYR